MADIDIRTRAVRERVIAVARAQIGSHYVWGGAGATPGNQDGAWYRRGSVLLHENSTAGNRRDHGRTQPMLFAAWCRVDGDKVCAGRCDNATVHAMTVGDPDNAMHDIGRHQHKWVRPHPLINSRNTVYGECCQGIRHFDCIGFVNWVLSEVVSRQHRSISQWERATRSVGFRDVHAGDILTKSGHIGFATGAGTAVHASGTRVGVVETPLRGGGWTRCGRLNQRFWSSAGSIVSYGPGGEAIFSEYLEDEVVTVSRGD